MIKRKIEDGEKSKTKAKPNWSEQRKKETQRKYNNTTEKERTNILHTYGTAFTLFNTPRDIQTTKQSERIKMKK